MTQSKTSKFFFLLLILILTLGLSISPPVQAQSGLQVIIHSVKAEPVPGEAAFSVRIYLSVLDNGNAPVKNLQVENFNITEDSQPVELESVSPVLDEGSSLVLVMDTSGSMAGQGIMDARSAAANFIQGLGSRDQAAVLSFNNTVTRHSEFTSSHLSSSQVIKEINVTPYSGTCLFDAAYQALEMAATAQAGRRGVILFTDGKDETPKGEKCSFHTPDDVLELAQTTSTPIYTLGLGTQIDENELKRMAGNSGGSFLASSKSSELDALFTSLYEQLNNEYMLTYTSSGAPGPHTLTVAANYGSQSDQVTHPINLPNLPTTIVFNSPGAGSTLSGKVSLKARLLTQGGEIARIDFAVDGNIIGEDISEPYEYEWDASLREPGPVLLEAVAIGKDGAELARAAVNATVVEPSPTTPVEEQPVGAAQPGETDVTAVTEASAASPDPNMPIYLSIGALALAGSAAFFVSRRKKPATEAILAEAAATQRNMAGDSATMDELDLRGALAEGQLLGTLKVLASDDPDSIGHLYNITRLPVIIGRSAEEAGILFSAKDQAVSRLHAKLEAKDPDITLRDMGSKYGTTLNGLVVRDNPVVLQSGDEIVLGARARLLFEQAVLAKNMDAETFDDPNIIHPRDEETRSVQEI